MPPLLEIHPDHLAGDPWLGDPGSGHAVRPADVAELRLDRWPAEVVLKSGRIGFVGGGRRRELVQWAALHGLPAVTRTDVWALLLEDFLDTEHDEDHRQRSLDRLEASGVSREAAAAIRRFVGNAMLTMTALTWEWVHYGLWDLLRARPLRLAPGLGRDAAFLPTGVTGAARRRWAEEIANRAPELGRPPLPLDPSDDEVARRLRHGFLLPRWEPDAPPVPHDALDDLRDQLLAAWSAPHRAYHGPRHLLAVLDALPTQGPDGRTFTLAAWFHDAVYDPRGADNEEASAAWLEQVAPQLLAARAATRAEVDAAAAIVRATARPLDQEFDGDSPARRFHDADFGVFASLPDAYDRYVTEVRREYAWVPDDAFTQGRRAFLEKLRRTVDRRGGFYLDASPFAEWLARGNLERERAGLGE